MALLNDVKLDFKVQLLMSHMTQADVANKLGVAQPNIPIALSNKCIVNKNIIKMWEVLGYDIQLVYVPRKDGANNGAEGGAENK